MDIEEIIQKVVDNGRIEDMEKLSDMLEDTMEIIEKYDKECYDKYLMELYKMAYGDILNIDMAEQIVSKMKPYGKRWSIQETEKIQDQYGIDDIRSADFFVVLNSAYNDYRDLFEDDMQKYIKFTMDFIQDEDAKPGKVFLYFTTIPE